MFGNQSLINYQYNYQRSVSQTLPQNHPNLLGNSTTYTASTNNSSQNIPQNITFFLRFSDGQSFQITANRLNSFESVLNKFMKEKFKESFNFSIKCALCNTKKIDFKKSLKDNNITQNSHVLCLLDIKDNLDSNLNNSNIDGIGFKYYGFVSKEGKNQQGVHTINQDLTLVYLNVGTIKGFNLFGVLDGNGPKGDRISEFCREYFFTKMNEYAYQCKQENIDDPDTIYNKLKSTNFQFIKDCFTNADIEMTKYSLDYNLSGTTCNLVIQLKLHLICANVGDSRSIIIYDNDTKTNQGIAVFSNDHLPNSPNEMARIINSGGIVDQCQNNFGQKVGRYRVFKPGQNSTGLAISRSLGAFMFKQCGVINQPEIKEFKVNHNTKYLLICSDGIWRYLKNEEVRNLGNKYYPQKDVKSFCINLVQKAMQAWQFNNTYRDDITIVCIFF